jgi:outer membrane protein
MEGGNAGEAIGLSRLECYFSLMLERCMNRWGMTGRACGTMAACAFAVLLVIVFGGRAEGEPGGGNDQLGKASVEEELSLEQCLKTAMENNRLRPASVLAVSMAEAQHRQALSGYWPQVSLKAGYVHMSDSPDFLFPAVRMPIPAQAVNVPGGTASVTIPAGALGNPVAITLPISYPGQTVTTPASQLRVPAQDVKLMDPDTVSGSLNATWLLYDGGLRRGLREQTQGLLDIAKQEARRTDLEIADSVRRFYYGAVLARQLLQVGNDAFGSMETTLSLTEGMYKQGAGKVMKTDYLENKVMVESLRSAVALLEKNQAMSEAALANSMGLAWNVSVKPATRELPYTPYRGDLDKLVGSAYEFSPDWGKMEAGLQAAQGSVRAAKSGFLPKIAFTGELHKIANGYNAGLMTSNNKEGGSVGVGIELPLFDGFLTWNRVREARARQSKTREESFLLKEGLGLQIKNIFLGLSAAQKASRSTLSAMKAAREDRELNISAYENGLVDTEKVIRAQLIEALMSAHHYKTLYDVIAFQSQLNLVVGTEVVQRIGPTGPSEADSEN